MATFFTNRGLCYLKLGQWDLSVADCKRALEMDPNLIKGHFFLGQALIEQQHYDDAMKHLQRGNDCYNKPSLFCFAAVVSNVQRSRGSFIFSCFHLSIIPYFHLM